VYDDAVQTGKKRQNHKRQKVRSGAEKDTPTRGAFLPSGAPMEPSNAWKKSERATVTDRLRNQARGVGVVKNMHNSRQRHTH